MKKRKVFWGCLGVLVLAVAGPYVGLKVRDARLNREFQDELALARKDGIPTNAAEFAATLPAVPESENAAPEYLKLRPLRPWHIRLEANLEWDLILRPTQDVKMAARQALAKAKPCLDILDRAVAYPHCRFDRDYSKGIALLSPELSDMKSAALLALSRGCLAAAEGRSSDAISDARKAFRVGRHLEEDPLQIGVLVSRSIEFATANMLANWVFAHPEEPAYRNELKALVESIPPPRPQAERRLGLIELLSAIELCETAEGRRELGLMPGDESRAEGLFSLFQSKGVGRIRIVRGFRAYWAAFAPGNEKKLEARTEQASSEIDGGLMSFPTAFSVVGALGGSPMGPGEEIDVFAARKLLYRGFLRAIGTGKVLRKIDTADLVSPLDGKPIRYSFDGKRIVLSAGKGPGGDELQFVVPRNYR